MVEGVREVPEGAVRDQSAAVPARDFARCDPWRPLPAQSLVLGAVAALGGALGVPLSGCPALVFGFDPSAAGVAVLVAIRCGQAGAGGATSAAALAGVGDARGALRLLADSVRIHDL